LTGLEQGLRQTLRPLVSELVGEELDRRLGVLTPAIGWLTVEEYAEQRRTTPAAVHKRLERGQIPGAVRDGKRWLIPASAGADTVHVPTRGASAAQTAPPRHREIGAPDA
jgi:hypothetical protein